MNTNGRGCWFISPAALPHCVPAWPSASIGTRKPLIAWSHGFKRSGPAKAGTPNRRFMESLLGLAVVHWDHEPRQLVGRGVLTAPRLGGLWTARPTLRFMERG